MANALHVTRVTVNDTTWTALTAAQDSTGMSFVNIDGKDMYARIDPNDSNTEWPIAGGVQDVIAVPRSLRSAPHRWAVDDVICYLKQATAGTSTVVLKTIS